MPTITDWTLLLGFDDGLVNKGIKSLDSKFAKLDKTLGRTAAAHGKNTSQIKNQNHELKAQNVLRSKMNRAEKLGLDIGKYWNVLHKGSITSIRGRSDELQKEIIIQQRLINKAKEKQKVEQKVNDTIARRPQGRGVGGNIASAMRIAPVTTTDRGVVNRTAERAAIMGAAAASSLQGVNSAAAIGTVEQLRAATERLTRAKIALGSVMSKNDPKWSKYKEEVRTASFEIAKLNQRSKSLTGGFNTQKFAADGVTSSLKNMVRGYASVFAAVHAISAIIRIGRDLEDTSAVMLLASGNAALAAEDMSFITSLSKTTKMRVADLSRSFAKFAVAGRTAGVSTEVVRQNFEDLSVAIRSTGLSQDRANLAFLGFQQMLAGPVVQAQEMNQIIEQMPQFAGAASVALREMGHEAENYRDAIKTGTVDSKEFIAIVSRLMKAQAVQTGAFKKAMDSITGEVGATQNAFDNLINGSFKAGLGDAIKAILKSVRGVIELLDPVASSFSRSLSPLVEGITSVFNLIVASVRPVTEMVDAFSRLTGGVSSSNDALDGTVKRVGRLHAMFIIIKGVITILSDIFNDMADAISRMDLSSWKSISENSMGFLGNVGRGLGILEPKKTTTSSSMTNSNNTTTIEVHPRNGMDEKSLADEVMRQFTQQQYSSAQPSF